MERIENNHVPGTVLSFVWIVLFDFQYHPMKSYYYPAFINEETVTQRDGTFLKVTQLAES